MSKYEISVFKDIGKPDKLSVESSEVRERMIEEQIGTLPAKWAGAVDQAAIDAVGDRTMLTPKEVRLHIKEINEIIELYTDIEVGVNLI